MIVDGPAHGRSAAPENPFTLDDCAGAALDVLEHLGIDEPVDWVGNAWGGHVGITFAATSPGRVRSLATIGTPVHALTAPERRQINLLVPVYRAVGPIGPVLGPLTTALLGEGADPEAIALVAEAFSGPERRGMARAIRSASLDRQDLTSTLTSVPAPALFAMRRGRRDLDARRRGGRRRPTALRRLGGCARRGARRTAARSRTGRR